MAKPADAQQLTELREQAKQIVDRFVRRFDESYRTLAYHAALPLVLTPELVNYLRNEFLRNEQVPWVAEVDLLLSDLCSQVGYELYAMNTHVRAYLLEQMKNDTRFGKKRMQEVAKVLFSYVSYLSRLNPGKRQQELEAQRLAAMVYSGDDQCKAAAREIAQRLLEVSSSAGSANLTDSGIRAELARLTRITEELSPQLQQEPSLLEFARLVQRLLRTPEEVSPEEINRSYQVEDVKLTPSSNLRLFPEALARIMLPSKQTVTNLEGFPPLQTCNFEVVTITIEEEKTAEAINLRPFEFEVATIEFQKSGLLQRNIELIINRRPQQTYGFIENLGNEIALEMVQIPGGSFIMGAPINEKDSKESERPQHQVTVPRFFMGKYPVTQAQWKFVASLPQVKRSLKPDPSRFKGDNRPVEEVSWFDVVEYCDRISQHTGRMYRLPSEAEWEYACRAGTSTPFHFGETITSGLANYNANYIYGKGVKGTFRKETTNVGSFGVANAFGLYDMHGNVWEWCEDHWHSNYEGAPLDGSAWLSDNDNNSRLLRGGFWANNPGSCRSAYRNDNFPDYAFNLIGFRVVYDVLP
jgi:formylglycine-generating enzyme required for sulfatase activity